MRVVIPQNSRHVARRVALYPRTARAATTWTGGGSLKFLSTTATTSSVRSFHATAAVAAATVAAAVTSASPASAAAAPATPSTASPASSSVAKDLVIYQYKICPFCNKVKAVLDFLDVPYRVVEVDPFAKKALKATGTDYRKVPLAMLDGEEVRESSEILRAVLDRADASGVALPAGFRTPETEEWVRWADGELAVLLFPNITRNFSESYQAFGYISDVEHFSLYDKLLNRNLGAVAMWAAQGKLKKKYGIDDEREALAQALDKWAAEVGDKPFAGGDTPNVADLSVYGVIHAIEGLATHDDIMSTAADGGGDASCRHGARHRSIAEWYGRMRSAVGSSSCLGTAL